MTVTSVFFLLFLACGLVVYYFTPGKVQWVVLLLMSLIYYVFAATGYTFMYLVGSALLAYVSTNLMENESVRNRTKGRKYIAAATAAAIVGNILIWFFLKGSSFWITGSTLINMVFPGFPVLSALPLASAIGMGYYTAQVIGYILDCYWGTCRAQKNPLKLLLFVCFFPQLTVGPISRYSQMQQLYEGHQISYDNLCLGCQRILWGFFKKLVISDRVGVVVSGIWADTGTYNGFWIWVALLLYPLQIYTDFSGCMDIILGSAEIFDIHLPENFNNPFFARTCQEFWQRWHITLGTWAKDYVYYPVLKSKWIIAIGKWSKKRFSKRTAKLIPWMTGMGILWFVMGFWHGSVQHIIGVSAWYWVILVLGEVCLPAGRKLIQWLQINTENFSWHLFQSIRTYTLYAVGALLFSANGLREAFSHYKMLLTSLQNLNPWIFFDGSILGLTGGSYLDINIMIVGVICLFIVGGLRERYGYARSWMQKQNLVFRWGIWILLFVVVLIYGSYGPGYDASIFIYEGF